VALVECTLAEDTVGIATLLRQGNPFTSSVILSKMLAEVITEQAVSPAHFREWAKSATARL
jgi:hypothetical protein